jgi:hypothetical protein
MDSDSSSQMCTPGRLIDDGNVNLQLLNCYLISNGMLVPT